MCGERTYRLVQPQAQPSGQAAVGQGSTHFPFIGLARRFGPLAPCRWEGEYGQTSQKRKAATQQKELGFCCYVRLLRSMSDSERSPAEQARYKRRAEQAKNGRKRKKELQLEIAAELARTAAALHRPGGI